MSVINSYAVTMAAPDQAISQAAQDLITEAKSIPDLKPYQLAQRKLDQCETGDDQAVRFWRSVWVQLMLVEHKEC